VSEGAGLRRRYRGAILSPVRTGSGFELRFHADGALTVEDDRIVDVGAFDAEARDALVHDLRGSILVPGFVDTHVHVPQTRVIGSASGPLLEWLESSIFPEEARFSDDAYARTTTELFLDSTLRVGTTSFMAFSSSHERATEQMFEAIGARGVRATLGLTLMDERCPPALAVGPDDALAAARALADRFHGRGLLRFAVTPRFALSCSRRMLEGAAALAHELDLPIQTHIAENPREGSETLAVHPFASDYLGVYEAVGLVGPKTILAHAIHLSDAEWERVAAAGAAIAHCPDSNYFLGSGRFDLSKARARGVRVGLASDVAAGRTFDLRAAVSYAFDTAREVGAAVDAQELFARATLLGADAIGLGALTGSLEPGKQADFVALTPRVPILDESTALRLATFGAALAPVTRTYVAGRLLFDGRASSDHR
jgi:guanine deaminase